MEEGKNVGEVINKLRRNNNMTQQELADKLNVKHQTIQKYEKRNHNKHSHTYTKTDCCNI